MAATLTLRVYSGAGAATESGPQTAVYMSSTDGVTSGNINAGSYSYERWLRLKVDSLPATGVTGFWLQNEGVLPADVILRFGVTDTPSTPVATASSIATMELTPGRRFIFDTNVYDTTGDTTRYLVLQEQVLLGAGSGATPQLTPSIGWSDS